MRFPSNKKYSCGKNLDCMLSKLNQINKWMFNIYKFNIEASQFCHHVILQIKCLHRLFLFEQDFSEKYLKDKKDKLAPQGNNSRIRIITKTQLDKKVGYFHLQNYKIVILWFPFFGISVGDTIVLVFDSTILLYKEW